MSVADTILRLIELGATPEMVAAAAEGMVEAAKGDVRSKGAIRQARYRERNKPSQTVTSDEGDDLSLKAKDPTPQKTQTLSTPSQNPPKGGQKGSNDDWPADYVEQFWAAYRKKVGRKAVLSKLAMIKRRREVTFARLMAGVGALNARDIDPEFIPNPLTWLNQGRWDDAMPASKSELSVPTTGEVVSGRFYAKQETPQFEAWTDHWRRIKGKPPPTDRNGGWFFDSEWPPDETFHLEAAE